METVMRTDSTLVNAMDARVLYPPTWFVKPAPKRLRNTFSVEVEVQVAVVVALDVRIRRPHRSQTQSPISHRAK
ncbi:unnamed protein product [Hymenolepis diminuta]|uniref:Uncharacterized protein n=1 Tax=Hymenolepis diminuta TaxID=6216 RepID=A0A0R3SND1_HYMDI|nr:unnamed protein product [Hymenolepis diminuta]